jgi:hypothetical protein
MDSQWISWISSALLLIGNVLLIKYKSYIAFILFLIGNIMYFIYWFIKQEWAAFILVGFFSVQNIWGIWSWRKDKKNV